MPNKHELSALALRRIESNVTELNWTGVVFFLTNWPMVKQEGHGRRRVRISRVAETPAWRHQCLDDDSSHSGVFKVRQCHGDCVRRMPARKPPTERPMMNKSALHSIYIFILYHRPPSFAQTQLIFMPPATTAARAISMHLRGCSQYTAVWENGGRTGSEMVPAACRVAVGQPYWLLQKVFGKTSI